MLKLLNLLATLMEFILGVVKEKRAEEKRNEAQQDSRRIDADPVGVFRERFGVPPTDSNPESPDAPTPDLGKHSGNP